VNNSRHAPRDCPVCGERLALTRLGCDGCGTELSGHFTACEYCSLPAEDRTVLRVFLASRGNMKDLERHLGVSYPTARARFDALLRRLGVDRTAAGGAGPTPPPTDVLEALAAGDIDVEEAMRQLG